MTRAAALLALLALACAKEPGPAVEPEPTVKPAPCEVCGGDGIVEQYGVNAPCQECGGAGGD